MLKAINLLEIAIPEQRLACQLIMEVNPIDPHCRVVTWSSKFHFSNELDFTVRVLIGLHCVDIGARSTADSAIVADTLVLTALVAAEPGGATNLWSQEPFEVASEHTTTIMLRDPRNGLELPLDVTVKLADKGAVHVFFSRTLFPPYTLSNTTGYALEVAQSGLEWCSVRVPAGASLNWHWATHRESKRIRVRFVPEDDEASAGAIAGPASSGSTSAEAVLIDMEDHGASGLGPGSGGGLRAGATSSPAVLRPSVAQPGIQRNRVAPQLGGGSMASHPEGFSALRVPGPWSEAFSIDQLCAGAPVEMDFSRVHTAPASLPRGVILTIQARGRTKLVILEGAASLLQAAAAGAGGNGGAFGSAASSRTPRLGPIPSPLPAASHVHLAAAGAARSQTQFRFKLRVPVLEARAFDEHKAEILIASVNHLSAEYFAMRPSEFIYMTVRDIQVS